jgi:hypothetical protein
MKTPINGLWLESRLLSCISQQTLQFGYLLLAGIAVVAVHARFHWPLKMPGHHGLEWMGILIFVRRLSPLPNAATLIALSASVATVMPVWGFHDNSAAWSYLLGGVMVDAAYRYSFVRNDLLALTLVAGSAHSVKPLLHWAFAEGFGMQHGSLRHGLPDLLTLHFLFGMTGATIGGLMARITQKVRAG